MASGSGSDISSASSRAGVGELGVTIQYATEVIGFTEDDAGVDVSLSDGRRLRARYLVGCDGGRSLVRKAAGIEFPGWDASTSALLAEAEMADEPELGTRHTPTGVNAIGRIQYEIKNGQVVYADHGPVGVMVTEAQPGAEADPTLRDVSDALIAVYGTDYGIHSPIRITRFTDMSRQAGGSCWPATPRTCISRRAAKASTPACRTR